MPKASSRPATSGSAASAASVLDSAIRTIRGERVIVDADLATIYGVPTKVLNQAVRRNITKFPRDFILQLTRSERLELNRSQSVTGSGQRHRTGNARPFAFTEHGAIMAANILNSPQAVQMSVFVVRAFIKMRAALTDTREPARKLCTLEAEVKARLDTQESAIVDVLRRIMALLDPPEPPPAPPPREMGFHSTLAPTTGTTR